MMDTIQLVGLIERLEDDKRELRGVVARLTAANAQLAARVAQLELVVAFTADGEVVDLCEHLFCPYCNEEVAVLPFNALCRNCVNPDDGEWPHQPPRPLFLTQCLSRPKTAS